MTHYLWPGDSGWPTPESEKAVERDLSDPDAEVDLDAVCLHAAQPHLLDRLSALERTVVQARYGLDGAAERSMKELHTDLGLTRHAVRDALESGLAKLRAQLAA